MDDTTRDMMEAAFPYVPPSFKRPLAAFLKFQELQKFFQEFDTSDMIYACDMDHNSFQIEQMLLAMRAKASPEMAHQLDTILNAMKMLQVYENYQEILKTISTPAKIPEQKKEPEQDSGDALNNLLNELIKKNAR